jgi:hypothetical protein
MFRYTYIKQLLNGQLTEDGYLHFVNVISFYIRKYNWPKLVIASIETKIPNYWSNDEIKEFSHNFFEWAIIKGKFEYLNKIPESYISYYFLQILVSFVANRIKEEQNKEGLNFEKCRELVLELASSDFIFQSIDGVDYVFNKPFNKEDIKPIFEIENEIKYVSKIPLDENVKHFKPLVKIAIEDIFTTIESAIPVDKLIELTFKLFNQTTFNLGEIDSILSTTAFKERPNRKHKTVIDKLLLGMKKADARLVSEYLFHNKGDLSLADLAIRFGQPKSSIHKKIESFKKKISTFYRPDNEDDGIIFIQFLSQALDEASN